jgi:nucleoside-diphosphate-sugar epimerase
MVPTKTWNTAGRGGKNLSKSTLNALTKRIDAMSASNLLAYESATTSNHASTLARRPVHLARGHLAALNFLADRPQLAVHNLGTGRGSSVFEALRAFEKASGRTIPYQVVERRPGDIAECYADTTKARHELGWTAEYDLNDMCRDAWKWQSRHPDGFG